MDMKPTPKAGASSSSSASSSASGPGSSKMAAVSASGLLDSVSADDVMNMNTSMSSPGQGLSHYNSADPNTCTTTTLNNKRLERKLERHVLEVMSPRARKKASRLRRMFSDERDQNANFSDAKHASVSSSFTHDGDIGMSIEEDPASPSLVSALPASFATHVTHATSRPCDPCDLNTSTGNTNAGTGTGGRLKIPLLADVDSDLGAEGDDTICTKKTGIKMGVGATQMEDAYANCENSTQAPDSVESRGKQAKSRSRRSRSRGGSEDFTATATATTVVQQKRCSAQARIVWQKLQFLAFSTIKC